MHHAAYVSADQGKTRHFYEDVLGIPLAGFWIEREVLGGVVHEFSLSLYNLADGSALSFFNFADPALQEQYTGKKQNLFVHLALNIERDQHEAMRRRLEAAGIPVMEFHHGYARSLYVEDPDGQTIELCAEPEHMEDIHAQQAGAAHQALNRWQGGDRTVNNTLSRAD
jgi:catechol 2,3-dioxygenase-like lactoylglutathione lyase family enzyme